MKNLFTVVSLLYIITWSISPPTSVDLIFRLLFLACLIFVEVLSFCERRFSGAKISIYLFLSFINLMTILLDGQSQISVWIQLCICLLVMSLYYNYEFNEIKYSLLFWWAVVLVIVWNITTLYGYGTVSNASRLLARNLEGNAQLLYSGIGGYGYVYAVVFMLPMSIYFCKVQFLKLRPFHKVLIVSFIVSSFAVILKSQLTLSLIFTFATTMLVLIVTKTKFLSLFIFASAFLAYFSSFAGVDSIFQDFTDGTTYNSRYQQLMNSLSTGATEGDVYERYKRYSHNFECFLKSPICGQLKFENTAGDSTLLRLLAQYGLFGGGWFCLIIIFYFKRLISRFAKQRVFLYGICFLFLLFTILNSLTLEIGFVFGIFFPVSLSIIDKQQPGLSNSFSRYYPEKIPGTEL